MDIISNDPIEDDIFSLEEFQFGLNWLAYGKVKDIEGSHV